MKPASKPEAHEKYQRLIAAAKAAGPVSTAVAHPCDEVSLKGAVEAARQHLIDPILTGPAERIRRVAAQHKIDVSGLRIMDALHSHDSAAKAVELARNGEAEALMKGSLHTDELMGAVVARESGMRTSRRISHCFVMDVPSHPDALIITDAAVNIAPTLEIDIAQNAIDLANALNAPEVRVAVLSAVETVNPKILSSLEAAALSKMAERGQITGAAVDGPLAPVAGRANVLVVPDLEAGNMLAKALSFLAGADSAGIVLGARVPIILTSRADSLTARLASCAVAALIAKYRRDHAAVRPQ